MQINSENSSTITISLAEYDLLRQDNRELKVQNAELKTDLAYLRFQMEKLQKMIFASKGERFIGIPNTNQLLLDFNIETIPAPEVITEEITYNRQKPVKIEKPSHGRMPLPAHLPRVVQEINPPEEEIQGMKRIGQVISETLEYKEAELYVLQTVRWKYAPENGDCVVIAPLPSQVIPRGNPGASLLAYLLVSKMVDHLPFYRLVQILKRVGINLAESTINDWMAKVCKLMEPLYVLLKQEVLSSGYIQTDDTTHKVLTQDKPGSSHRGHMMDYLAPLSKLLFFDYQPNRNIQVVHEILKDYEGAVQTDGLNIYDHLADRRGIILLACWAHARRRFFELKDYDPECSKKMLTWIGQLYDVEKVAREKGLSPEEIYTLRQKESKPVLDQIHDYLIDLAGNPMLLKKNPLRSAVDYVLPLWDRLTKYIEDGRYCIDNNPIENSIRPLVLSRKNHLFAGSHQGASRLAMIFSFTGSCKLNGVNPQTWLTDVLSRIQDTKQSELIHLLPNRWGK
jgi:transposase